jgi:hypothetical protein
MQRSCAGLLVLTELTDNSARWRASSPARNCCPCWRSRSITGLVADRSTRVGLSEHGAVSPRARPPRQRSAVPRQRGSLWRSCDVGDLPGRAHCFACRSRRGLRTGVVVRPRRYEGSAPCSTAATVLPRNGRPARYDPRGRRLGRDRTGRAARAGLVLACGSRITGTSREGDKNCEGNDSGGAAGGLGDVSTWVRSGHLLYGLAGAASGIPLVIQRCIWCLRQPSRPVGAADVSAPHSAGARCSSQPPEAPTLHRRGPLAPRFPPLLGRSATGRMDQRAQAS